MIKTVNLAAGTELAVDKLGGANTRIVNRTSAMLYASRTDGIIKGGSNVLAVPSGKGDYLEGTYGRVYLLSEAGGEVQLEGADTFRPFDSAAVTGGKAVGNPVVMDGLQGGVPFSEITVSGEDISGKELTLNVCGKNMLKYPYHNTSSTVSGVSCTDNGDGTVTVNGTAAADIYFWFNHFPSGKKLPIKNGKKYTISGCPENGSSSTYMILLSASQSGKTLYYSDFGNGLTVDFPDGCEAGNMSIKICKGTTVDNLVFRPQLELGAAATDYEPYSGTEYKITTDSNPYTVPTDIRQLEGRNTLYTADSGAQFAVTYTKADPALSRVYKSIDALSTALVALGAEN